MGMFNSVYAACATCGELVEFQSKEGECFCNVYRLEADDAPTAVLTDVLNDPQYCRKCGNWMALVDPAFPPNQRPPRPQARAVKLRQPAEGEFHTHSSQTFIRWWDAPFSFDDIASADTHPQGGDAKQAPGDSLSGAVPNEDSADAQPPSPKESTHD